MALSQSPAVTVTEIAIGGTTPNLGDITSAFVGHFNKGAVEKPIYVNDITSFTSLFGEYTSENRNDWYQVRNFLEYKAGKIKVARAVDTQGFSNKEENYDVTGATVSVGDSTVTVGSIDKFKIGTVIALGTEVNDYKVVARDTVASTIGVEPSVKTAGVSGVKIHKLNPARNSVIEVEKVGGTTISDDDLLKDLVLIKNDTEYGVIEKSLPFSSATNTKLKIFARSCGIWGNEVKVAIANSTDFGANKEVGSGLPLDSIFRFPPVGASQYAIIVMSYNDDTNLEEIVESFIVSNNKKEKLNGKNIYVENIINTQSAFIYVKDNDALTEMPTSKLDTDVLELKFGTDGKPSGADISSVYEELFSDAILDGDTDILIANEKTNQTVLDIAKARQDVVGLVGGRSEDYVGISSKSKITDNAITWRGAEIKGNNSYGIAYANYKFMQDVITGKEISVSIAGDVAGVIAKSAEDTERWFAPAGTRRGQLIGITSLPYNPDKSNMDRLYTNGLNPIYIAGNAGALVWGNNTLSTSLNVFLSLNVRLLFNLIKRALKISLQDYVFEQNDELTRTQIRNLINSFLRDIQSRRGIDDFRVICDGSNNTPQVVSQRALIIDVYIQPTRSAEFIQLNLVGVDNSLTIDEIIPS